MTDERLIFNGINAATGNSPKGTMPEGPELCPGMILLDQWRLVRELGRGTLGVVYEAVELHLGGTVALKILDPGIRYRPESLERFRRTVAAMRAVIHPRIVRVFDYREQVAPPLALVSMEYVKGGCVRQLRDLARETEQPIPLRLALTILAQTLDALAAAHAHDLVHGNVTPGNVLLAGGTATELLADPGRDPEVRLADLGFAVDRGASSPYAAPEALRTEEPVRPAADVYSAGALFYDLLTGSPPTIPVRLPDDVPPAVATLLLRLLDRDPARRPLAARLLEWLTHPTSISAPAIPREGLILTAAKDSDRGRRIFGNVLLGIGGLLDLGGTPRSRTRLTVTEALARDWRKLGHDFHLAIQRTVRDAAKS